MHIPLADVCSAAQSEPQVIVTVVATFGSTPREVGARMLVSTGKVSGSIGGGQLEFRQIDVARALLAEPSAPWLRATQRIILGPDAGQCCGGVVEVLHERIGADEAQAIDRLLHGGGAVMRSFASGAAMAAAEGVDGFSITTRGEERELIEPISPLRPTLFIYGAGHVAQALIPIVATLPFDVHWIDDRAEQFPDIRPPSVRVQINARPMDLAGVASPGSLHLVMTHDHDLDAEICTALLTRNDVAFVGLIGSTTKRARFVQRFRRAGFSDAAIAKLVCPVGHPDVPGKAPVAIAVAIAAQLLMVTASAPATG
jgi:xanthine dehydrogenase accessory factor